MPEEGAQNFVHTRQSPARGVGHHDRWQCTYPRPHRPPPHHDRWRTDQIMFLHTSGYRQVYLASDLHVPPITSFLILTPEHHMSKRTNYEASHHALSLAFCYFFPSKSKHSPNALFSNTLKPCSSLSVTDRVSCPYQTPDM